MSGAREEILERVRGAIGTDSAAPPRIQRSYRRTDQRTRDQLVAVFCERAGDYKAEVQRIRPADLRDAISAAASRHDAKRLVIPVGLPNDWRSPELELITDQSLTPRELDKLDGVITACTIAIAETGTIALTAGPHEGRRLLSLVPDLHICVVAGNQIVGTVPEAIAQIGEVVRTDHRPVTLISGPSATSDIELQRIEGVHGPRNLVVLVTQESA